MEYEIITQETTTRYYRIRASSLGDAISQVNGNTSEMEPFEIIDGQEEVTNYYPVKDKVV